MGWTCPRCRADYDEPRDRCEADGWRLVENLSGRTIGGRYVIDKLVGVGGMRSAVWRAMQQPTGRPVALKILPSSSKEEAQRFERGARIASNLNHPHITTVHDYGTTPEGAFYLVMELLEGQTLQQMLKHQPASILDALVITDQILRALEHAHAHNVVHRDLKPANLFLTRKNDDIYFVKIMDFGLAKLATATDESGEYSQTEDDDEDSDPRRAQRREPLELLATPELEELNDITQAQRICGTPEYMAPEQILGGPLDRRTDLYALGIILYRMLAGSLPFRAKVRHELYQQHLAAVVPPFPASANVPDAVARVVMKALAKRSPDRYVDAAEMRVALRAANRAVAGDLGLPSMGIFQSDVATPKPSLPSSGSTIAPPPRRRRTAWIVAAALLLVGGGIAVAIGMSGGSNPGPTVAEVPREAPPATVAANTSPSPVAPPTIEATPAPSPASPGASAPAAAQVAAAEPARVAPVEVEVEPTPQVGVVAITTTPTGVEVWHAGMLIGTTPLDAKLPTGQQTIELRGQGLVSRQVPVMVTGDREVVLGLELAAAPTPRTYGGRRPAVHQVKPAVPAEPASPSAAAAAPAPTPGVNVLGGEPPRASARVLGQDLVEENPTVKILGEDLTAPPAVRAKVLGQ